MGDNKGITIPRMQTGIEGFEEFSYGGLPKGRTTLVSGTSGSGKTIFASAFIYFGAKNFNEPGVFVTFEELPSDIKRNMKSFGWDLYDLEKKGKIYFVDLSKQPGSTEEVGSYSFSALIERVRYAVKKTKAKRVALDSISAVFERFKDREAIRDGLYELAMMLKNMGITTVLTGEREEEKRMGTVHVGPEEFVSDNVIILHSFIEKGMRNRTIEILKFRGTDYDSNETQIVIDRSGMKIFQNPVISQTRKSSNQKIKTGIEGLDKMTGGGLYKKSTTLVTGASGTGKTITAMHFILEGAKRGEKGIYVALEESEEQLIRNANSFGQPLQKYIKNGAIMIHSDIPEGKPIEEHYKTIENLVKKIRPKRFVIDSLSGIERNYSSQRFRGFTVALNNFLKNFGVTSMMTNTTPALLEVSTITETRLSTATDNILILKYVELGGMMRRLMSVLKERGSDHEKNLMEFRMGKKGIEILGPFIGFENLLGGSARTVSSPTSTMKEIYALREKLENKQVTQAEFEKRYKALQESLKHAEKEK
jgi:circadian clock protein KaiC